MKIILYMAMSVNGYIAKKNHETPWTDAEYQSYSRKVKEVGNLIIGKTTFDLMNEEDAFANLNQPFVVVLTTSKNESNLDNVVFVQSFSDALVVLEKKGFSRALIGGGGQIDTVALNSGLIDELFLDIEPLVFGDGISLFAPTNNDLDLELLETTKIGNSGIQLHYRVMK